MIDLTQKTLSEAILMLGEEINRGCWLLDRQAGVPVAMVSEVQITATVTAHPDRLVVEAISAAQTGPSTSTQSGQQTSSQNQSTNSVQSGANTTDTTYQYKS